MALTSATLESKLVQFVKFIRQYLARISLMLAVHEDSVVADVVSLSLVLKLKLVAVGVPITFTRAPLKLTTDAPEIVTMSPARIRAPEVVKCVAVATPLDTVKDKMFNTVQPEVATVAMLDGPKVVEDAT